MLLKVILSQKLYPRNKHWHITMHKSIGKTTVLQMKQKKEKKNIVDLVCKMQANVIDKSIACSELESIGVYELKAPVTKNEAAIPYSTEPSNVKINDVTVLFDSYNNQWLLP